MTSVVEVAGVAEEVMVRRVKAGADVATARFRMWPGSGRLIGK